MDYLYMIQFFGQLLATIYVYTKIQNIQSVKNHVKFFAVIFTLIIAVPLSSVPPFYELIFIGYTFSFVFFFFRDKNRLNNKFSVVIPSLFISIAFALAFNTVYYFVCWYILKYILIFVYDIVGNESFKHIVDNNPSEFKEVFAFIQIVLTHIFVFISINLFFKSNQLKKGFVFLQIKEAKWTCLIFAITLMFTKTVTPIMVPYMKSDKLVNLSILYLIFLNGSILAIINIWWRYYTRTVYQLRVNQRTLDELQMENDKLNKCNKFLSETVHRDNKLFPSMYSTVSQYLDGFDKGASLLSELDELMKERKETISKFNKDNLRFSSTGLDRIDSIISYMHSIALEKSIELIVVSSGDIKELVQNNISKSSLETILADLIENAIIATSFVQNKKIFLTIGTRDNCYQFEIKDSGIPFELNTLNNLGIKKSTTYAGSGGSGIGYLKIFEILKETNASYILTETENENSGYTKSIKIKFDNKYNFIICSDRIGFVKNARLKNV